MQVMPLSHERPGLSSAGHTLRSLSGTLYSYLRASLFGPVATSAASTTPTAPPLSKPVFLEMGFWKVGGSVILSRGDCSFLCLFIFDAVL